MNNLTVIIPFFNGHKTIQRLLDSLPYDLPVIIVDDHSDSDKATIVYSTDCPTRNIKVIRPEKKGYFTGAVNRGIEACNTDVLILNQDTYFTGLGWLEWLFDAPKNSYDLIGESIKGKHPYWPQGYIHGTFMCITKRLIDRVGLLNEVDYPLWGSTCEYQLRVCRQGFNVLPLPSIPDFVHLREGQFGDGIQTILEREPDKKQWFVDIPPKISVVTACHNYGQFLPDLVNSLIGGETSLGKMEGQSFQSFELVIVDYGSTDNTPEVAQNLASDWQAIRYIRTKDNGSAAAFNAGIKAAYGQYIAVIDADDMMEPFRLETLYRLQLQNPHSFIYDDLVLFANGKRGFFGAVRPNEWDTIYPTGFRDDNGNIIDFDFDKLLTRNGIAKGIMFPKVAWQEVGGYPELMKDGREDWAFNVALGLRGWCGKKADKPGYLYRRGNHNRTLRNTSPEWQQKFTGQMLTLYADIYRGYRPMGCCGGSKLQLNGAAVTSAPYAPGTLPGRDGFEILEYIGGNAGDMTWYGPETRTRYIFGGNRRVGYVDKRDVAKMVALVDQNQKVFKVYQKPVETQPLPEIQEELLFDPGSVSVNVLKQQIAGLEDEQLTILLAAEKEGLNRKGAIAAIEEALNVEIV